MKAKWFQFSHPIPGSDRPFTAAHLALVTRDEGPAPSCGTIAVLVPGVAEPGGFIVACCKCLAISESPS
jgi:hypothetical protein